MTTLFISGIDTGVGKTQVSGTLAKTLIHSGLTVFTQKLIETGCDQGVSNDLLEHERIVGKSFNLGSVKEHSPYTFLIPASPHLSAELEGVDIETVVLTKAMHSLESQCDHLLVEGAGGLCVPFNNDEMLVDFVASQGLPLVLVTSAKLGSINHTILSLEMCRQRDIEVRAVVYNHFPVSSGDIFENTRQTLQLYLQHHFSQALWMEITQEPSFIGFGKAEQDQLLR